jgi:uncharacterized membrane protein YjgN (DUF898 family)
MLKYRIVNIVSIILFGLLILLFFVNLNGISFSSSTSNCAADGCFGNTSGTVDWDSAKALGKNEIVWALIIVSLVFIYAIVFVILSLQDRATKGLSILLLVLAILSAIVFIVLFSKSVGAVLGSSSSNYDGVISTSHSVSITDSGITEIAIAICGEIYAMCLAIDGIRNLF